MGILVTNLIEKIEGYSRSRSPKKGAGNEKGNRDAEENISRRHVRSRSPVAREDVDVRKNRKIDDHGGKLIALGMRNYVIQ